MAWWASGFVCILGAIESFWMEEVEGRMDRPTIVEEEAPLCEPFLNPCQTEEGIPRQGSLDSLEDLDLSAVKA